MSNVTNKLHEQSSHQISDSEIENWALTAVSVVERFITERNALRERVRAQDRELSLLREQSVSCVIAIEGLRMSS